MDHHSFDYELISNNAKSIIDIITKYWDMYDYE